LVGLVTDGFVVEVDTVLRAGIAILATIAANGECLLHGAFEGVLIDVADVVEAAIANGAGFCALGAEDEP